MNRIRLLAFRIRIWFLEAHIEHVEEQIPSFKARRNELHERLRRVKTDEAMATPARNLLMQAMARKP